MAIELTTATTEQLSGIRQSLAFPQITDMFPNGLFNFSDEFRLSTISSQRTPGSIFNAKNCQLIRYFGLSNPANGYKIEQVMNAQDLINLQDVGTVAALNLSNNSLSESTLNQLFTDLPSTNKTATINVAGNPGAATCDPTIATNKGYTVVTS
jgi:hypothetical protein